MAVTEVLPQSHDCMHGTFYVVAIAGVQRPPNPVIFLYQLASPSHTLDELISGVEYSAEVGH